METWVDIYKSIGYDVILCSVKSLYGLNEIKAALLKKVNLFCGTSGVGKSSILNAIYPFLSFKTSEISIATSKGKHTTVTSLLRQVGKDTSIIDTPGIREIDPYGIRKENLSYYFIDFIPFLKNCRFNTCTHYHEPGCGIVAAVEEGRIFPQRYESYLNLQNTIEEDMLF